MVKKNHIENNRYTLNAFEVEMYSNTHVYIQSIEKSKTLKTHANYTLRI